MAEEQQPQAPRRVLGVFAHPDDAEFFAGGTFAKWAAEGAEITFLLATSGDKGSPELEMTSETLAALREEETKRAAAVLGVKDVIFLRYKDGELFPDLALRRDITRVIRLKKPDVVVTLDPTRFWYGSSGINHPDHRAIGAATLEAVFPTARDRLNFIELERDEGLEPHKALTVYICRPENPTVFVDVSDHLETQVKALIEHKSQIKEPEKLRERIFERSLDPSAAPDQPRHIEPFHMIQLRP